MKFRSIAQFGIRFTSTRLLAVCMSVVLLGAGWVKPALASPLFTGSINVQPTLDPIGDQTVLEDSGATILDLSGIADGDGGIGQDLSITATSSNKDILPDPLVAYVSPDAAGTLTFTPNQDRFTEAAAPVIVTVTVTDNGGTDDGGVDTLVRTFEVSVTPVNDPPSFTKGATVTVAEDCGPQTVAGWATQISAGPFEVGQTLTFSLSPDNPGLFAAAPALDPASGNLTFTPTANASGTALITVTLKDNGGTQSTGIDTASATFNLVITPVNDPPVVSSFNVSGVRGKPLGFSLQNFTAGFSDVEASGLASLKILTLPETGHLTLNGLAVAANTEIPAAQIPQLGFVPATGWYGDTSFQWTASDGQAYAAVPALAAIGYPFALLYQYVPTVFSAGPIILVNENFEGNFPGAWQLYTAGFTGDGYVDITDILSWGKKGCQAFSGSYGAWGVGGGSLGSGMSCGDTYPDDFESWMVYGPFDLSSMKDGLLKIKYWSDVEKGYDVVGWGFSLDNDTFYGHGLSNNSDGWKTDTLDLKNIYQLGDVTGKNQVWLGFWLASDDVNPSPVTGAAVDDVTLTVCPSIGGCGNLSLYAAGEPAAGAQGTPAIQRRHHAGQVSGLAQGADPLRIGWLAKLLRGLRR
jgi:hypothetical protein